MSQVIYKYQLNPAHSSASTGIVMADVEVPLFHKILKVGEQDGNLFAWILIDDEDQITSKASFYIVGTGWKVPSDVGIVDFLDTVLMKNGLVWHIFVKIAV